MLLLLPGRLKLDELTFNSTILTDPSLEQEFRLGVSPTTCCTMKLFYVVIVSVAVTAKVSKILHHFLFTHITMNKLRLIYVCLHRV